jgi:Reverse transcriptase (RNA-dependent DNA polymerase)
VPLIDRAHFARAVQNIAGSGDTDVFPLPFENHVLHDEPDQVCALLESVSNDFETRLTQSPPITNSALAQVGYNGFRWATQIDPMWNAYFLGVVLSLAEEIESVRIPVDESVVFSHRFDVAGGVYLFNRDGWTQFRDESLRMAGNSHFVVSVDIADFYGRLYHHRIENELKYVDRDGARANQVTRLLNSFSNNVSYGLPIGGPAARILSELVLSSVDKLIQSQLGGARFTRYADDYRFFVDNVESAYRVIGFMSEKLQRNEGLSLQRSKTRIMTSSEFKEATFPGDPRPGSAEKFLSLHLYFDPYSPTAEEDYEDLREQLSEFDVLGLLRSELFKGRIDAGLTRRLMSAIRLMDAVPKEQAIRSLLENIETLAPIIPNVIRVVRDNIAELSDDARVEVFTKVRELIDSGHHLAQVDVNLAYMVRLLSDDESRETTTQLVQMYDRAHGYSSGPAPNIQRDIVLALARRGTTWWLHDRKPHFPTMHSWVQRSFILGSYALGDEGKHWRAANRRSFSPFDSVVADWAAARTSDQGWRIPV